MRKNIPRMSDMDAVTTRTPGPVHWIGGPPQPLPEIVNIYNRGGIRGGQRYVLKGPISGNLRFGECLTVRVEADENGSYVVSADAFLLHGDGDSVQSALADYRQCLGEYYEIVEEGALGGNPYSASELQRLRTYITTDSGMERST